MSTEENKALIRRLAKSWVTLDLETFEQQHASSIRWHGFDQSLEGRDAVKELYLAQFDHYEDRHYTVEDLIAEGDKVVGRFVFRGTLIGGEQEVATGINIYRISDGKIEEAWFVWQDGQFASASYG